MKRRIVCLLTAAFCCCLLAGMAFADVIWEPENRFYEKHSDECTYLNRSYIVNSPEGGVRIYSSPESHSAKETVQNGEKLRVYFTYAQETWGYVYGSQTEGWAELSGLTLLYDHEWFCEDFADQFYEDEQAVQAFREALEPDDVLQVYSYPCSGSVSSTLQMDWVQDPQDLGFQQLFRDEEGRVWGYLGYFMGHRDWICLTDPTNDAIPEISRQELELYSAAHLSAGVPQQLYIAAFLVAGVVIVSLVLLIVCRRRKYGKR